APDRTVPLAAAHNYFHRTAAQKRQCCTGWPGGCNILCVLICYAAGRLGAGAGGHPRELAYRVCGCHHDPVDVSRGGCGHGLLSADGARHALAIGLCDAPLP
ncbi:unnamed protein product, partial [Symbiodinium necroappetens]